MALNVCHESVFPRMRCLESSPGRRSLQKEGIRVDLTSAASQIPVQGHLRLGRSVPVGKQNEIRLPLYS